MGVVPPLPGFLEGLREITRQYGALLIFDEVITGFRLSSGGVQKRMNVLPDLTTMGKIIGGGLPVGAYGGRREIMDQLAPDGPVYQAGTLSGNPLAMSAGKAMLSLLKAHPEIYQDLEQKAQKIETGIRENIRETGVTATINRVGSIMTLFFSPRQPIRNYEEAMTADTKKYSAYFELMLNQGIYLAPSQFECLFVSTAHTEQNISRFLEANRNALKQL